MVQISSLNQAIRLLLRCLSCAPLTPKPMISRKMRVNRSAARHAMPGHGDRDLSHELSRQRFRLLLEFQAADPTDVLGGLEHDPEKWVPVFRKDHAQTKR